MEILVERLIQMGYFLGQTLIVVVALIIVIGFIFNLSQKNKQKQELEIEDLNQKWKDQEAAIKESVLDKKEQKALMKAEKKDQKKSEKEKKKSSEEKRKKRAYVLDFDGDVKAGAVDSFRDEITAVLQVAEKEDEVVVKLESPGGVVHGYGLAAAQLMRIKEKGIRLTICVDKVAASGGYMMACVGDKIYGAPFAIFGSIGVLAQVPNFHKILKKNDVEYKEVTAGDFKRTLTIFGEITEKGEEKFREQIVDTHHLFKEFVSKNRPSLDIDKVGTGEYWFGLRALDLGLFDEIKTSDDYLLSLKDDCEIRSVKIAEKKSLAEKIGISASQTLARAGEKALNHFENLKFL